MSVTLRSFLAAAALALLALGSGCASTPYIEPIAVRPARPGPGEAVLVENSVIVFDASGSIDRELVFPREKAVLEAFVTGMPAGSYRSSLRVLGGRPRDELPPARFDRWSLQDQVRRLPYGGRETPLANVLRALVEELPPPTRRGTRNALILFSDGVPTQYGRYTGPAETLRAALALRTRQGRGVCFHLIQLGEDPRAASLLEAMRNLTGCGSYQRLGDLEDATRLEALERKIYIGPAPPPEPELPRAATDLDADGVDDRFDLCANTPRGARVDERGCWVIEDTVFETDRARILELQRPLLDQVAEVLRRNPGVRVRLDGHTDDRGADRYNFDLGERRARSVARYLEGRGIAADRLVVRSFGATRPISDNDGESGRSRNRRVELSVIDW